MEGQGTREDYSLPLIVTDVFGAGIYLTAVYIIIVNNRKDLRRVDVYRLNILADFFFSFFCELLISASSFLGVFATMKMCPSYALRMGLKITSTLDILLLQFDRFHAFHRPLLHQDSPGLAYLQISMAKVMAFSLTLVATFIAPTFLCCSSCPLCILTRPIFVYMTSSLCIITAIISTCVTIYTFFVFRRQMTLFKPTVISPSLRKTYITGASHALSTSELSARNLRKHERKKTMKSMILLNLSTILILLWISGEFVAILHIDCDKNDSCSSYVSVMKYFQIIRIIIVLIHPLLLIFHLCNKRR